jgi:hypothetical protein
LTLRRTCVTFPKNALAKLPLHGIFTEIHFLYDSVWQFTKASINKWREKSLQNLLRVRACQKRDSSTKMWLRQSIADMFIISLYLFHTQNPHLSCCSCLDLFHSVGGIDIESHYYFTFIWNIFPSRMYENFWVARWNNQSILLPFFWCLTWT